MHHLLAPSKPKNIARLANSTKGDKDLGLMIQNLDCSRVDYVENPYEDGAGETVAIRQILSLVRHCTEVTLEGSGLLRLLLPSKRSLSLPHLETLRLVDLDSEFDPLFNMSRLCRLNRFRSLRHLTIDLSYEWQDETDFANPSKGRPLTHITTLSLAAGPCLGSPAVCNFISHLPNLERLTLELQDVVEVGTFLQACPHAHLTELGVEFVDWFDIDEEEDEYVPLDADLARFTSLQHLTLGRDTFSRTCELFPILAEHVHDLRALELLGDCELVASKLIAFVAARGGGPSRALERVKVDTFYARATLIPSEVPGHPEVRSGTFKLSERWNLPAWTPEFTFADAKELVAVAEKVGVAIEGRLLEAIKVETLRPREEAYLEQRRDEVLYSLRALFEVEDEDGSLREAEARWAAAEREWDDQQDDVLCAMRSLIEEEDEDDKED